MFGLWVVITRLHASFAVYGQNGILLHYLISWHFLPELNNSVCLVMLSLLLWESFTWCFLAITNRITTHIWWKNSTFLLQIWYKVGNLFLACCTSCLCKKFIALALITTSLYMYLHTHSKNSQYPSNHITKRNISLLFYSME